MLRILLVLWMSVSLVGCASLKVVQRPDYALAQANVHPNDEVDLVLYSGQTLHMKVIGVLADGLAGVVDSKQRKFAFAEIQSIEQRDEGHPMLAGLGIGVAGVILLLLAGMFAMERAFESWGT